MAVAYFRSQIYKAKDAKRKADINRIQQAVEEYEKDHDCYPPPELLVCDPGFGLKPYLNKIPCDPVTGESYPYEVDNDVCASWYRSFSDLYIGGSPVGPDGAYKYSATSPNAPNASLYPSDFYGCKNGSCSPIYWDVSIPGLECSPNWGRSDCYSNCPNDGGSAPECS